MAQNKPEAALEIAERGRARAFVELLAKRLVNSGQPSAKSQQPAIKPPTIQQIKQIAKDHNATLVQYSVIWNEALYIWVVKPSGDIAFRQVNLKSSGSTSAAKPVATAQTTRSAFSDPVNALRTSIRGIGTVPKDPAANPAGKPLAFNADPRLIKIQLRNLHQRLIDPIADLLPTDPNQHIIFMPQGELFLVPFAALEDSSGKTLIEKHTILTASSIQVLELTRKERSEQRGVRSGNSGS